MSVIDDATKMCRVAALNPSFYTNVWGSMLCGVRMGPVFEIVVKENNGAPHFKFVTVM